MDIRNEFILYSFLNKKMDKLLKKIEKEPRKMS